LSAGADSISHAAANVGFLTIFEFRLEMSFTSFGFDVFHSARAHLEVQATARIFDELEVTRTARAVTRGSQATAPHLLFEFGFDSVDFAAVANGVHQAVAERISLFFDLNHSHGFSSRARRSRASSGKRTARRSRASSGRRNTNKLIVGNASKNGLARALSRRLASDRVEHLGLCNAN